MGNQHEGYPRERRIEARGAFRESRGNSLPRTSGSESGDFDVRWRRGWGVDTIFWVVSIGRRTTNSFHFNGVAYSWYCWIDNNRVQQTWEQFLKGLRLRFAANLYHDPRTALKELKQTASVGENQSQFEELSNQVTRLIKQWLVLFFIVGLKDHLKYDMLLAQLVSYASTMSIAKIYEQKQLYMQ